MSASNLFDISGNLLLDCAVSPPAVSASLVQSGAGFIVVYAGEAVIPVGTPGSLAVTVTGVTANDLVITTVNGSGGTAANLLVAVAGVASANTVTLTATVTSTALNCAFLVIRLA